MHDPCVTLPDKDVYTISTKYRYFLFVTILLANVGTVCNLISLFQLFPMLTVLSPHTQQDGWASIGSSMEDLRINLKVTHAQIIAVTTVFPYSYVIGCASAYFTLDRFNRQLQYCLALFTFSVSMVLISFCSQMSHLTVSMVICGFSNAYTDTISITWTIELFRNRTQVALLVVFLFLSIGSTLSPLLMSPFVTTLDTNAVDFDLQATEPNHRIRIPFLSLAAYIFSCAILHLLSFSYKVSN